MNKLTLFSIFIISIFFQDKFCKAQCHIDDWTALKALYESTNGDNWTNNTNWHKIVYASNAADCSLNNVYGLHVNAANRVTVIGLPNNQLNGELPSEIGGLAYLRELHLFENKSSGLSGVLPAELGNLTSLISMDLYDNNFSGVIPAELGNLTSLSILQLSDNNLSGTIPPEMGNLIAMKDMRLRNNRLSGNIPSEFGNLENIENLDLGINKLSGNIPSALGNLSKLIYFYFNNNNLSGEIPVALTKLTSLYVLFGWDNQLTGEIPEEINALTNLGYLGLGVNELSGEIPTSLGDLDKLIHLSLDQNFLNGEIPKELGNLSNLKELWIWGNQLSGSIPAEFGNLRNMENLSLSFNQLSGCFSQNLNQLCGKVIPAAITDGNNFDATWEDFCANNSDAACPIEGSTLLLPTNYSNDRSLNLHTNLNGAYIIQNQYGKVSDYTLCNPGNSTICPPVNNIHNKAANEVLWAIENAALYFSSVHNIVAPPVNSFVLRNEPDYINDAAFNNLDEVLYFGAGDQSNFSSMTAPDIVGHEFSHYLTWIDEGLTDLNNTQEPGALKESFADIFGELVEKAVYGYNDWVFGKQVTINSGGIRSLINPLAANMQTATPNFYEGTNWQFFPNYNYLDCLNEDRCSIHTNCGVQNYWFYLLSEGGVGANGISVNGIGMDKAAQIVVENLKTLNRNATYKDAMFGSILAAKALPNINSNEVQQTINAWKAVGLDVANYNPITFQIANEVQIEEPFIGIDGRERVMMQFDLLIDSLGQDLTADGLEFTLTDQLNGAYKFDNVELKAINPILQANEFDTITYTNSNDFTLKINRLNNQVAKAKYNKIASRTSIATFVVCIVVIDITGGTSNNIKIDITGGTTTDNHTQLIVPFQSGTLLFGSNILDSNENNGTPQYFLDLQMQLSHKNCKSQGTLYFEIIDDQELSKPPYTYNLSNDVGIELDSGNFQNKNVAFYNLDEGDYELYVEDNSVNNRHITKNFRIQFRPDVDGSICCRDELIISYGNVSGTFSAVNEISINSGTTVSDGLFNICD